LVNSQNWYQLFKSDTKKVMLISLHSCTFGTPLQFQQTQTHTHTRPSQNKEELLIGYGIVGN